MEPRKFIIFHGPGHVKVSSEEFPFHYRRQEVSQGSTNNHRVRRKEEF